MMCAPQTPHCTQSELLWKKWSMIIYVAHIPAMGNVEQYWRDLEFSFLRTPEEWFCSLLSSQEDDFQVATYG